jgi:hypothetical protein
MKHQIELRKIFKKKEIKKKRAAVAFSISFK